MFDLANPEHYEAIVLSFGNGIIEKARIIGESKAGVLLFINLISRSAFIFRHQPIHLISTLFCLFFILFGRKAFGDIY